MRPTSAKQPSRAARGPVATLQQVRPVRFKRQDREVTEPFPSVRGIGERVSASWQQSAHHKPSQSISSLSRRARNEVALRRRGSARRKNGAPAASALLRLAVLRRAWHRWASPIAAASPSQVLANPSLKLTPNGIAFLPRTGCRAHRPVRGKNTIPSVAA